MTNEFATVGYRAHSQVHGALDPDVDVEALSGVARDALEAGVEIDGDEVEIPLNVAFGNPGLLRLVGLEAVLAGLGAEREYANDEMLDNQVRSVLFQVPGPDIEDPAACLDGEGLPGCFSGVLDLGAIDVARGRDNGIPTCNELRAAYGLPPVTSFAELTGEATDAFPDDPAIDGRDPLNDPDILGFVSLRDDEGREVAPGSPEAEDDVVSVVRRTSLAARLKAIYGTVDRVDAFVGMNSEPHVWSSELGELQRAMWATSSRRCETAAGSSSGTTRCSARSPAPTASTSAAAWRGSSATTRTCPTGICRTTCSSPVWPPRTSAVRRRQGITRTGGTSIGATSADGAARTGGGAGTLGSTERRAARKRRAAVAAPTSRHRRFRLSAAGRVARGVLARLVVIALARVGRV
ncbi:MAG TPA: peroxidase family protein [Actinomycetota bacterium]|nr:peroxidase family protein [Actinomycetota bacterium]